MIPHSTNHFTYVDFPKSLLLNAEFYVVLSLLASSILGFAIFTIYKNDPMLKFFMIGAMVSGLIVSLFLAVIFKITGQVYK